MSKSSPEAHNADQDKDGPAGLKQSERESAASGPTPPEAWLIHEVIREDGEREIGRTVSSLAWSGFGAGLSMGFSFLALSFIRSGLPHAPWAHLVSGFGYTIGFLIAVLGRQQLYTESTLTAVLPFLTRRDAQSLFAMLRLWLVVLVFNVLGTFAFAFLLSYPELFPPDVTQTLHEVSREALSDPFVTMTLKAVLSGWLIALMVWLLPGAGQGRLMLIIVLTYVVAAGQLPHVVAGSVEVAFAWINGDASGSDYLLRFFAPTLLGNTLGGASLVAILNHAPVRDEIADEDRSSNNQDGESS